MTTIPTPRSTEAKDSAMPHPAEDISERPLLAAVPDAGPTSAWATPSPLSGHTARAPYPVKSLPRVYPQRPPVEGPARRLLLQRYAEGRDGPTHAAYTTSVWSVSWL